MTKAFLFDFSRVGIDAAPPGEGGLSEAGNRTDVLRRALKAATTLVERFQTD
jgi:hypothetical protein